MNFRNITRRGLVITVLAAPLFLGACASTKSVDEAKAMAEHAQSTADQALAEAKNANTKVDGLGERVDRMYQQSLKK